MQNHEAPWTNMLRTFKHFGVIRHRASGTRRRVVCLMPVSTALNNSLGNSSRFLRYSVRVLWQRCLQESYYRRLSLRCSEIQESCKIAKTQAKTPLERSNVKKRNTAVGARDEVASPLGLLVRCRNPSNNIWENRWTRKANNNSTELHNSVKSIPIKIWTNVQKRTYNTTKLM